MHRPCSANTVEWWDKRQHCQRSVTAENGNGNVDAEWWSLQGDDDMNFKTVNGSVCDLGSRTVRPRTPLRHCARGIDSDFP